MIQEFRKILLLTPSEHKNEPWVEVTCDKFTLTVPYDLTTNSNNRPVFMTTKSVSCERVRVKCTLVQALRLCTGRTAHRGSRGIALPFHDHGTRRG